MSGQRDPATISFTRKASKTQNLKNSNIGSQTVSGYVGGDAVLNPGKRPPTLIPIV